MTTTIKLARTSENYFFLEDEKGGKAGVISRSAVPQLAVTEATADTTLEAIQAILGCPTEAVGLILYRYCANFAERRYFIHQCLNAGLLRCLSPHRRKLCGEAALQVSWIDQAEWYPCCESHYDDGPQWVGSTRFPGGTTEVIVFPEESLEWLAVMATEGFLEKVGRRWYVREIESQDK